MKSYAPPGWRPFEVPQTVVEQIGPRFAADAPLAEINWPKVYAPTAEGYTDYPTFDALTA